MPLCWFARFEVDIAPFRKFSSTILDESKWYINGFNLLMSIKHDKTVGLVMSIPTHSSESNYTYLAFARARHSSP